MSAGGIQFVKDWKKEMQVPLTSALSVTHELCGRSLAEACKHAIILMAQSARKLTPQARKRRKIERDGRRQFYTAYRKTGVKRWYLPSRSEPDYEAKKDAWGRVRNVGLAKRSWMWGLKGLKGSGDTGKPMGGMAQLERVLTRTVGGFILRNKLPYIAGIMPAGWDGAVQQTAANRIMKQAQLKLERRWKSRMDAGHYVGGDYQPDLSKYLRTA
jgi:hypothetical protein